MRELSLHILDLVQNSITAQCSLVKIEILECTEEDSMKIKIEDDGRGMDKELLESVRSPFTTTRTTRDVGLGIPLFEAACERCEGELHIDSTPNIGTKIHGCFRRSHFDKPPIGRINETLSSLLLYDNIDIEYRHVMGNKEFLFKTREIREMVGDGINDPAIVNWVNEYILEHLENIGVELWS